jgi:hypothetical protein
MGATRRDGTLFPHDRVTLRLCALRTRHSLCLVMENIASIPKVGYLRYWQKIRVALLAVCQPFEMWVSNDRAHCARHE